MVYHTNSLNIHEFPMMTWKNSDLVYFATPKKGEERVAFFPLSNPGARMLRVLGAQ